MFCVDAHAEALAPSAGSEQSESVSRIRMVKLVSSDRDVLQFRREAIAKSRTLDILAEEYGYDEKNCDVRSLDPIDVDVRTEILIKVMSWCLEHKDQPEPVEFPDNQERRSDDIEDSDNAFCDVDDNMLYEYVTASYLLDIRGLLEVTCKTVANQIKDCRDVEEIREKFNIINDFTPEEEEEIRRENAWMGNLNLN